MISPGGEGGANDHTNRQGRDLTCTAKLYAVTRADLPPGLDTAQVGHALITWVLAHGAPPDNLVVLVVPDEATLLDVAARARAAVDGARVEVFREPDLDGEATAAAVDPRAWRALSSLPLLGRPHAGSHVASAAG